MPSLSPADAAFAAQWSLDEIPACPAGLALLRQLAETEPRLYSIAEKAGFTDPADRELAGHSLWRAFFDHYAACGDCNEV